MALAFQLLVGYSLSWAFRRVSCSAGYYLMEMKVTVLVLLLVSWSEFRNLMNQPLPFALLPAGILAPSSNTGTVTMTILRGFVNTPYLNSALVKGCQGIFLFFLISILESLDLGSRSLWHTYMHIDEKRSGL